MSRRFRSVPFRRVHLEVEIFRKLRNRIVALPKYTKRLALVIFDLLSLTAAVWISYALRYDGWFYPRTTDQLVVVLAAPAIAVPIFVRMGLYRAVVRYLPERALWTILQAMTLAAVAWVVFVFLAEMSGRGIVPRSVPILYWALGILIVAGSRFAAKIAFWPRWIAKGIKRQAVVIYGAGQAGTQLAMSLRATHQIAGFIDDDRSLHGRDVAGIRVHPPSHLSAILRDFGAREVILSIPSLSATRRRDIIANISGAGVKIRSLPAISELVAGKYLVSQIREIDLDELLGRSSVPADLNLIQSMVSGQTIMVTGAGGSIGSELCRKIAQWGPQRLVLFEANEYALYNIDRELLVNADCPTVPFLGSVTTADSVRTAIRQHGVSVVFHAAAHKHVPLVEANALEGIRNNVFGTKTVADIAFESGVRSFVLISTDKAVRPTNVMGATKRWAEILVQEKAVQAKLKGTEQRFCTVRFGNVLGSNGSVVPLFKEQLANGGPLTLTDVRMTRYFMSIHEAAELIVQAGALSEGGDVFLLDMGAPVLISDLAENLVHLAGLSVRNAVNPDGDIEIVVTGKRPGEKLYEELFYDQADAQCTIHPKIMRASIADHERSPIAAIAELEAALGSNDEQAARNVLFRFIHEQK